jgi:arylsulfatase A-like enzyme/Tfp pilus assembly protein PilF
MSLRTSTRLGAAAALFVAFACAGPRPDATARRPSILLVTLDTTRADAVGPGARLDTAPAFAALAARGTRFTQAYATAPQTLPSHTSMMSGLYPAGHGVHENGRRYDGRVELAAERLHAAGWITAAFVSGFPLDRQFGLARGFDSYDDELGETLGDTRTERSAAATTGRALEWLGRETRRPLFLWVHYYEPHEPYQPPEPWRSRFADAPYLGEIATMDAELGKLVEAFEAKIGAADSRLIVVGDHGESLGDHGERFHGNLLYQSVMRVPLVIAGGGAPDRIGEVDRSGGRDGRATARARDEPVSTRRVFDTLLGWAGLHGDGAAGDHSLLVAIDEAALGEAMQPFLLYGWQPQVMALARSRQGSLKAIRSGETIEIYDVEGDAAESKDLAGSIELPRELRQALREYPLPTTDTAAPAPLDSDARKRLASLGYLTSSAPPKLVPDAPRPRDMTHLFAALDLGSALFSSGDYASAIPVFQQLLAADPHNLSVLLRLAAAHSALGHDAAAFTYFDRAAAIDPQSLDLDLYRGLHELRTGDWRSAGPRLERVVTAMPERLPALTGLAGVRRQERRVPEAIALLERAVALERDPTTELLEIGEIAMSVADTASALRAYERARQLQGSAFDHDLELGVLYLDQQRLADAATALDRVPAADPRHPLALFKRAQVAALRRDPDVAARIEAARRAADETTRSLIANERLFAGY